MVIPLVLLVVPLTVGLVLLVIAGVIPEDPAIQREREKKTREEEEQIRAWQQLSGEEREQILNEEAERIPKEV
jgi:archaellum biogenesis protein FlaJ (TadC family)